MLATCLLAAGAEGQKFSLPNRAAVHLWARAEQLGRDGFVASSRGDTIVIQTVRMTYGYHPLYITDTLTVGDVDSVDVRTDDDWQRLYASGATHALYATPDSPRLRSEGTVLRLWSSLYGFVDQRARVLRHHDAGDAGDTHDMGDSLTLDLGPGAPRVIALASVDTLRLRMSHGAGLAGGAVKGIVFAELYAGLGYFAAYASCTSDCHYTARAVRRYFITFGTVGALLGANNGRRRETWVDVHARDR